jgi:hypothetical protein
VQCVEAIKGLVTYGDSGELFLFEAAGPGKKLGGPTKEINGVLYVEAMKGLVAYGYNGKLFLFDAAGPGKKLGGQRSTPWMRPSVPFYCKHSLSRSRLARSWAPLTRV